MQSFQKILIYHVGAIGDAVLASPTAAMLRKQFPDAHIIYFNSSLDCALAVKGGKADAACYDKPILKIIRLGLVTQL